MRKTFVRFCPLVLFVFPSFQLYQFECLFPLRASVVYLIAKQGNKRGRRRIRSKTKIREETIKYIINRVITLTQASNH